MGKWYEIARFENRFERNLTRVTAEYTLLSGNKIRVVNSGYLNGELNVSEGKAYVPDPDTPGKLKVAFFLWFYSDYYILELDEVNYNYVLIGSSKNNYLWILSRRRNCG
jgi:lipocalin